MLLDLDSTLLNTYGNQEGEDINYHYHAHGYHPLLCFDSLTGDLIKAELRKGSMYCCNGADEFMYQTKSWKHPRRVVCKIEKPYGQFVHLYTFIVTNQELPAQSAIQYYCNRGRMKNFIKECKNSFGFETMRSSSMIVNANRLMIHCLAYNLFSCFRRLVLPESMKKLRADTIRLKLLKFHCRE